MTASTPRMVVIAGVQKAGTTSLFNYLQGHPQVSPCRVKEPMYFFPLDYPVQSRLRCERNSVEEYEALFACRDNAQIRLEGTASYVHVEGSLQNLHAAYPDARIVLSFRDPIKRFVSWYKMVKMLGFIDDDCSIGDFTEQCLQSQSDPQRLHYLRGLEHGFYADALKQSRQLFGQDNVYCVDFDVLTATPRQELERLAAWLGIAGEYFANMDFRSHFESLEVRRRGLLNVFWALRRRIGPLLGRREGSPGLVRRVGRWFQSRIIGLATKPAGAVELDPQLTALLRNYYAKDVAEFQQLIGTVPGWCTRYLQADPEGVAG